MQADILSTMKLTDFDRQTDIYTGASTEQHNGMTTVNMLLVILHFK